MADADDVIATVRDYVAEHLAGEDPALLTDRSPLITSGILDSIATVHLASFLERRFGVEFTAEELTVDNLDTLASIARVIVEKSAPGR
jgi:acyl carrier protein